MVSLENTFLNTDCVDFMKGVGGCFFDMTLTDIPYNGVNRTSNGLRNLDKGAADVETFNLQEFLENVYRVTKSSIVIFCGVNQASEIASFFLGKKGTMRSCVWHKSNPSPMNGTRVYLSGLEHFIWFKKPGGTFNAHCKGTVFKHPIGRSKLHPTEKNHALLKS